MQPPGRTLTFLWLDEIRGSRQWLGADPERAKGVQYMFSLDMTGEDTAKTGGTFLIEKQADPSAVWARPSDPHTEWGASSVKAESLKGSLLNDLHLAVSLRRAKDTKWVVRTNPYEGGSDHTAFGDAGIPSVLNWHFTDRYYHTNLDRPDKTSAAEMVERRRGGGDERLVARVGRRARRERHCRSACGVGEQRGWRSSRSRAQRSSPRRPTARRPRRRKPPSSRRGGSGTAKRSTACGDCPSRAPRPRSTRGSPRRSNGSRNRTARCLPRRQPD